MPKSGGSSHPTSAWLLQSIPQTHHLCTSDLRLRPKEHMVRPRPKPYWQTPLPSLIPTSCSPISHPCQWLVAQSSNPYQLAPKQGKPSLPFGSNSAFGPICQTLAWYSLHSHIIFFHQLETKPKPCIHLELEMYFPLNTQMPVQSKSAPRQPTNLTRGMVSSICILTTTNTHFWRLAFKTTCLVIFKLGESFEPWTWCFIKLNTEVMMLVPQTTLLHEQTHMQAHPFSK